MPALSSRSGAAGFETFRLDALQSRSDVSWLPCSLKIMLENLLRTEGDGAIEAADIEAPASRDATADPKEEIAP
jgi:aconitate hydratase A / 2-methylisocitrate dehydratase